MQLAQPSPRQAAFWWSKSFEEPRSWLFFLRFDDHALNWMIWQYLKLGFSAYRNCSKDPATDPFSSWPLTSDGMQKIAELRSSTAEDRDKLERLFKGRLQDAEKKMRELRQKEKRFNKLERLQAQSEDTCRRLQSDIFSIKQQKVCSFSPRQSFAHMQIACNHDSLQQDEQQLA